MSVYCRKKINLLNYRVLDWKNQWTSPRNQRLQTIHLRPLEILMAIYLRSVIKHKFLIQFIRSACLWYFYGLCTRSGRSASHPRSCAALQYRGMRFFIARRPTTAGYSPPPAAPPLFGVVVGQRECRRIPTSDFGRALNDEKAVKVLWFSCSGYVYFPVRLLWAHEERKQKY